MCHQFILLSIILYIFIFFYTISLPDRFDSSCCVFTQPSGKLVGDKFYFPSHRQGPGNSKFAEHIFLFYCFPLRRYLVFLWGVFCLWWHFFVGVLILSEMPLQCGGSEQPFNNTLIRGTHMHGRSNEKAECFQFIFLSSCHIHVFKAALAGEFFYTSCRNHTRASDLKLGRKVWGNQPLLNG